MELNTVDWVFAVAQSHDFAFGRFGGYFKRARQSVAAHDERMITRRFEWIWQLRENACALMSNRRSFPMHQTRRRNDLAAEDSADALMPETNAEDRRR